MDATLTNAIPQIEQMVRRALQRHRLPGIALGIVRSDELAWFGGFGRADLEHDAAPTLDSLARVASVSKTFTATAIMQLRDEGCSISMSRWSNTSLNLSKCRSAKVRSKR